MKIKYMKLQDIKESENNAKIHTPEQIEQIKQSILDFGFNDPIGVDENGVILEGHGRYYAARNLGLTQIPVFTVEGLTDE